MQGSVVGTSTRPRQRPLVLFVDDTADVRDLYAEYFTAMGMGVITAGDAVAGFAAALQHQPDVIVMDLAMPRADGVTATWALKGDPRTRNTPVILLTGHALKAIERGALEAGAAAFLTKPCLPEDLEAHVRRVIAQPGLHDAA